MTDTYLDKVVLLLDFEGANGATAISDLSVKNNTVTFSGGAQISTAQARFGSSSLYLDGVNSYISISSQDFQWGRGPFTIEFSAYSLTGGHGSNYSKFFQSGTDSVNGVFTLQNRAATNPANVDLVDYFGIYGTLISSTGTVSNDAWHDYAIVYSGDTFWLFIDGAEQGNNIINRVYGDDMIYIRTDGSGASFYKGYIDNLRITKGYARR